MSRFTNDDWNAEYPPERFYARTDYLGLAAAERDPIKAAFLRYVNAHAERGFKGAFSPEDFQRFREQEAAEPVEEADLYEEQAAPANENPTPREQVRDMLEASVAQLEER